MAKESRPQRKTVSRVMHEFKHGELKSRGGKVKNPKQAVAIALSEAGASKYQSRGENKRRLRKTKQKERQGRTSQAESEGRSKARRYLNAAGRRRNTALRSRASRGGGRRGSAGPTRAELYQQARKRHIRGRSKMSKRQLQQALG